MYVTDLWEVFAAVEAPTCQAGTRTFTLEEGKRWPDEQHVATEQRPPARLLWRPEAHSYTISTGSGSNDADDVGDDENQ